MKAANPWITYRTRFLVKAKQLTCSLTFTDALGRRHSGRKGDYLVEFSDGVLRIASRQIFEDIYVPIMTDQYPAQAQPGIPEGAASPHRREPLYRREPLHCENTVHLGGNPVSLTIPVHLARKPEHQYREGRYPCPGSS